MKWLKKYLLCELNLWGIETRIQLYLFTFLFGVNWTCEGLKRASCEADNKTNRGCELNLWGIETLNVEQASPSCKIVWIEPVRDWNNLLPFIFPIFPVCELNLWGIETEEDAPTTSSQNTCELNLWGIETIVVIKNLAQV